MFYIDMHRLILKILTLLKHLVTLDFKKKNKKDKEDKNEKDELSSSDESISYYIR